MANELIKHNDVVTIEACPHPLKTEHKTYVLPEGYNIEEILQQIQQDHVLREYSCILINGVIVEGCRYKSIYPAVKDVVTIRIVPGKGGKNILKLVITIGFLAASFYLGPALGGALGIGQGGFLGLSATQIGRALISGLGMLVKTALVRPAPDRTASLSGTSPSESPTLFIEGARNNARNFGVVPVVLGTHKQVPPLGAKTYTEIIGNDEFFRMLLVWGYGPLSVSNIRIGNTLITNADGTENFADVEIETVEGRSGDPALTLFSNQVAQDTVSVLLKQADGEQIRTTAENADEISVDIIFPRGLTRYNSEGFREKISVTIDFRYILNTGVNAITQYQNAGGGEVTVTSAAHGMANGTVIRIQQTTNYDGTYTISNITTNTFRITHSWDGDDATGVWAEWLTPNVVASSGIEAGAVGQIKTSIGVKYTDLLTQEVVFDDKGFLNPVTDTGIQQIITTGIKNHLVGFRKTVAGGFVTATVSGSSDSKSDVAAIQVLIEGTDLEGNAQSETLPAFTAGTYGRVVSVNKYKSVTKVTIPAHVSESSSKPYRATFSNDTSRAYRTGLRWATPSRDQYDVGITRITTDKEDLGDEELANRTFDASWWSTLRSITFEDPTDFPYPLAMTALKIRATEQLNGVIDELSGTVISYTRTYKTAVAITAFANAGGGVVTVTSTGHGLTAAGSVIIAGTTNYNGTYTVLSTPTSETFTILKTFVITETGTWEGWAEGNTSNPASLFYHVLQSNAISSPLADSRIDLDALKTWHDFCETYKLEFNQIRDYQTSVWEVLSDIARVGFASPTQVDGKWSVVVEPVTEPTPVQHFTPRNSWGFEASKAFVDIPHALRVRLSNEDEDWAQDEMVVYNDGYSEDGNDENGNPVLKIATKFETLDALGITSTDMAFIFGRFFIVQMVLRPEQYTLNADFEYIIARRGDQVLITHDVLLVGLASGRIKTLTSNTTGDITSITVDETLTMATGNSYGISIRTLNDSEVTTDVVLDVGDQTDITFGTAIPVASAPVAGDIFGFGLIGLETIKGIVLAVEPHSELTARLTITPHITNIKDAITGTIPAFETKLTSVPTLPAVEVLNVRTDESVLVLGAGNTLIPTIAIEVVPVANHQDAILVAQIRTSKKAAFVNARTITDGNEIKITDVQEGNYYDVRLRWENTRALFQASRTGLWNTINNIIVEAQSTLPAALQNLTISVFGSSALLRWDKPSEFDVKFSGTVRFRHDDEIDSSKALWEESVGIGTATNSTSLFAILPLKSGTYLAKVFDKRNRPGGVAKVSTKQVSIMPFGDVETINEHPSFSGVHTNTVVTAGKLTLSLNVGDVEAIGSYAFANTFTDHGTDTQQWKVRLTSFISVLILPVNDDNIDDWTDNIDDREDWDGTSQASCDARVQVRATDDDPAGTPAWGTWENLESAEFNNRAFQFRINLSSLDKAFNIQIDTLQIVKDRRFVFDY